MTTGKKISTLTILALIVHTTLANFYEFTINPRKEVCIGDYFPKEEIISYKFNAVYSVIDNHEDPKEVSEKVKISSFVEGEDGTVYSNIKKKGQLKPFRAKKSQYIRFCFMNRMKKQVMARVDIFHGTQAKNVKNVVKSDDTFYLMEKMDTIERGLNHSISLYEQMESYEEKQVNNSRSVAGYIVLFSQISMLIIVFSGCGMVLILKKTMDDKKRI